MTKNIIIETDGFPCIYYPTTHFTELQKDKERKYFKAVLEEFKSKL
jgi:hypothetical protein